MHAPTPRAAPANRIHHAVGVLAPLWTSWTLETLRERGPLRAPQLASATPWLNTATLHQVLLRMRTSDLLAKPERGCYAASPLGQDTRPVRHTLASWHARHFEVGATAWRQPDRVEDALTRLRGKGTLDVLTTLEENGPLRPGALREATGLATGSFHYRTQQLLDDGLVTRLGPDQRSAYTLTPAARGLAPVYAELHDFGRRTQANGAAGQANERSAVASRAHAARQHSPSAQRVTGLFSHPDQPPPRVPAYVTALSHPARRR
ncbi:winged helix-turn-helix transcriptional regulator [Streptomyces reniochalinae]|uniref:Transcriptional regulator n=1 Tax=Streptomyces reniochalinae TaxID=2250578 RepID=A0A367EC67_9ACTN|nr:MarR family winged helix-turn-helix transcriptional regulator [Streptomyces reniochalinae]RCG14937.1 transcriptional regulator [Streptomyces reniochalinae]